jgi:hypothetical protein
MEDRWTVESGVPMRSSASDEEVRAIEDLRDRAREEPMDVAHQVGFLDLNGDGVPDAVITLDRRPVDEQANDGMIEEVISVAVEIGVDGRPAEERRYGRLVRRFGG